MRLSLLLLFALAAPLAGQSAAPDSAFTRREEMIPMRDGKRLFTVMLIPKNARVPLPFLMSRTPYGAVGNADQQYVMRVYGELAADGYIFVFQDIRGLNKSEGQFVMNRPPRPSGSTASDESTDTWDTIDWLVKNVTPNNGRVGMLGVSYPGWTTAIAGLDPHPALRAISPQAPMGDAWMGDDFFHQGAFRLSYGLEYAWMMEASTDQSIIPNIGRYDSYDFYRSFATLGDLATAVGANAWPTWRRYVEHPSYDSVWQARSAPRYLRHAKIPTLTVGGWWDQEDEYGPLATYAALESSDTAGRSFLVMGPWYHGQWSGDRGDSLGNIRFGSPTGLEYRQRIQAPWFRYWLHGQGDGTFAEATVYDAGANSWRTFAHWPPREATRRKLYLREHGLLSFDPSTAAVGADSWVSDPAHPVPYRSRPIELTYDPRGSRWRQWQTEDQRLVDGRPDVMTWQTPPLTEDVTIAGDVVAHLYASTTGTDADWVVKLIDVYPDSIADRPWMGGYELMVTGDIMRGRYRQSFEHPAPIPANTVQRYTVDLHQQAYQFRRGHRIMVQVQSTWFPAYDRNPQTYVPNIFLAPASAYRAATHRIHRTRRLPSNVEVMVL
ncbi:MAG: CocE/NonD family hydrolase, partial [Gemmatimonadota bacterium]